MAKPRILYTCQSCGYQSPKWLGRCPDCLSWNSLLEERVLDKNTKGISIDLDSYLPPTPISGVEAKERARLTTGIVELDRVLGGGIVSGSVVLVGGDPGIGKSTLLLQALYNISESDRTVLYVSGEESPAQIKIRASRIGIKSDRLYIYSENSLERILEEVERLLPDVVVIDSIQTVYTDQLTSTPGSIAQLREIASYLIPFAKRKDIPIFFVGHVTKEGAIAGPKVLEHMVDTVLYFEGDRGYPYRVLRTTKNRFGSVNEIGVFEMCDRGLVEVKNPSSLFISDRDSDTPGSVVVPSMEGSRPILIEIQSLVSPTVFGMPIRTIVGIDHKKVSLLIAVLEKKGRLRIGGNDVFLKIGGGMRIDEPAVDLGVVASIASNILEKPVKSDTVVFGEVGLTGEIRGVYHAGLRVVESAKLGFKRCILPKENIKQDIKKGFTTDHPIEIVGVRDIREFLSLLF